MLESFVVNLLQDYAEKYLEQFDKKMLQISLVKGDVQINHLQLKADALQEIHPALCIQHGFISQLQIKFSILKLKSEPVSIRIQDFVVLLKSSKDKIITKEFISQQIQDGLEEKIKSSFKYMLFKEEVLKEPTKQKNGYIKTLIKTILTNLKIEINNIHIRYEDNDLKHCVGLTVQSICLKTIKYVEINKQLIEKEQFVNENAQSFIKKIDITNFSVYLNLGYIPVNLFHDSTNIKQFLVNTVQFQDNYNYLIRPTTFKMYLETGVQSDIQKFNIQASIDNLNFQFTTNQLDAIIQQVQQLYSKNQLGNIIYYPEDKLLINKHQWWSYIMASYDSVDTLWQQKASFSAFIHLYSKHYIQYQQMSQKQKDSTINVFQLTKVEEEYIYLFYQTFSQKEINFCIETTLKQLKQRSGKFFKSYQQLILDDTIIEELLLQFIADNQTRDYNLDSSQFNITFKINQINVSLCQHQKQISIKTQYGCQAIGQQHLQENILSVEIIQTNFKFIFNNTGFQVDLQINNFILIDNFSLKEPYIIIQQFIGLPFQDKKQVIALDIQLLTLQFIKSNVDQQYNLKLQAQPLFIQYQQCILNLVSRLILLFKTLNKYKNLESLQQISNLVEKSFNQIQQHSQNAIKIAIDNHLKLKLQLKLQAPILSLCIDERNLLINLGMVSINTSMPNLDKLYDNYQVKLDNVYVFSSESKVLTNQIFSYLKNKETELDHKLDNMYEQSIILFPFKLIVDLNICILRNIEDKPQIIVKSQIENINVNINENNIICTLQLLQHLLKYQSSQRISILSTQTNISSLNITDSDKSVVQLSQQQEIDIVVTKLVFSFDIKSFVIVFSQQYKSFELKVEGFQVQINQFSYNTQAFCILNCLTFIDLSSNKQIFCIGAQDSALDIKVQTYDHLHLSFQGNALETQICIGSVNIYYELQRCQQILDCLSSFVQLFQLNVESLDPKLKVQNFSNQSIKTKMDNIQSNYSLKLVIKFNSISVFIEQQASLLTVVMIRQIIIKYQQNDEKVEINLALQEFLIKSLLNDEKYIVSFNSQDDKNLNVSFILFNNPSNIQPDILVNCNILSRIEIIIDLRFLLLLKYEFDNILKILSDQFSSSNIRQSQSVQQINIQQVFQIDANIIAPIIIIPISQGNEKSLFVDFGRIKISSSFTKAKDLEMCQQFFLSFANLMILSHLHENILTPVSLECYIQLCTNQQNQNIMIELVINQVTFTVTKDIIYFIQDLFLIQNNFGYNILQDIFKQQSDIDLIDKKIKNKQLQIDSFQYSDAIIKEKMLTAINKNTVLNLTEQIQKIKDRKIEINIEKIKLKLKLKQDTLNQNKVKKQIRQWNIIFSTQFKGFQLMIDDKVSINFKGFNLNYQNQQNISNIVLLIGSFNILLDQTPILQSEQQVQFKCEKILNKFNIESNSQSKIQINLLLVQFINYFYSYKSPETNDLTLYQLIQERSLFMDSFKIANNLFDEKCQIFSLLQNHQYVHTYTLKRIQPYQKSRCDEVNLNLTFPQVEIQIPTIENNQYLLIYFQPMISINMVHNLKLNIDKKGIYVSFKMDKLLETKCQIDGFNLQLVNKEIKQSIIDNLSLDICYLMTQNQILVQNPLQFIREEQTTQIECKFLSQIQVTITTQQCKTIQQTLNSLLKQIQNSQQNVQPVQVKATQNNYVDNLDIIKEDALNKTLLPETCYLSNDVSFNNKSLNIYNTLHQTDIQVAITFASSIKFFDDFNDFQPLVKIDILNIYLSMAQIQQYSDKNDIVISGNLELKVSHYNQPFQNWETLIPGLKLQVNIEKLFSTVNNQFITKCNVLIPQVQFNLSNLIFLSINNIIQVSQLIVQNEPEKKVEFLSNYKIHQQKIIHKKLSIKIENNLDIDIGLQNYNIQPLNYVEISYQDNISFVIGDQTIDIPVKMQYQQRTSVNNQDIFIYVEYIDKLYQVCFRPLYKIVNMTKIKLYIQNTQFKTFYTGQCLMQLSLIDKSSKCTQIDFNNISESILIDDKYFRLEYSRRTFEEVQLINMFIYPSFIITSYCNYQLLFDDYNLNPLTSIELYVNPYNSLSFKTIYYYEQFTAKNQKLFEYYSKVPVLSDQSKKAKRLRIDYLINKCIYHTPTTLQLASSSKESYYLGVKRLVSQKENTSNTFNYQIIFYPYYILVNRLFIERQVTSNYIQINCQHNTKYQCQQGDYMELGIMKSQKCEIQIYQNNKTFKIKQYEINNENTMVQLAQEQEFLQTRIQYTNSKQQLTRIITVYPILILRNNSTLHFFYEFNDNYSNIVSRKQQAHINSQQIVSSFQLTNYFYLQHNNIWSSPISLDQQGSFTILFQDIDLKCGLQVKNINDIVLIDIFEEISGQQILISNLTSVDFRISQTTEGDIKIYNQYYNPVCKANQIINFQVYDLGIPQQIKLQQDEDFVIISLNKIGKWQPKKFGNHLIFAQVDINANTVKVSFSFHKIEELTILQKATKKFSEELINANIEIQIEQIQIQVYLNCHNYKKTQQNVTVQIFTFQLNNVKATLFDLQETQALNLEVQQIYLYNLDKAADFPVTVKFQPNSYDISALSIQLEKIKQYNQFININVAIQPIQLNIDQSFLENILLFINSLTVSENIFRLPQQQMDIDDKELMYQTVFKPFINIEQSKFNVQKMFIAFFNISDIYANVNVAINDLTFLENNFWYQLFSNIASPFMNITSANIKFQYYKKKSFITEQFALINEVKRFYLGQIKKNIGNLIKSSIISGQTASYVEEQSSRMQDIKTQSRKLVGNSVSNIAGTVSSVASFISGDLNYKKTSQKLIRDSQQNGKNAMRNAGKALTNGFVEGLIGIVKQPIVGGQQKGFGGAISGIGKGIVGIFAKPVQGISDFVEHVGIAVETGGKNQMKDQIPDQLIFKNGIIE
ncbi:putative vacuolar sorting-associated protein 13 [Spironucleus salmonicida]|uniref:Vacuolar sorting-associated protein 13 n=1 Tax=Spironucleus salmonicida TaxID=348837 RepID=V6LCW3_9EUKA|nr:putative vacuolar sorting-associated protein 13 [Spironucleus salmonicida]|eukprot:EST42093.1 hypothetical protein SS50377_18401 [Spironucleus salmonicida]